MNFEKTLNERDRILARSLEGFLPDEIYDIHVHPYNEIHFTSGAYSFLKEQQILGCGEHNRSLLRYMPVKKIHGLYFGMPHKTANRALMNTWIEEEVKHNGTSLSRTLDVVAPGDDPQLVADRLRAGHSCGLKVYHVYSSRNDTMNASVTEFAPEWMWEILHETKGILMLHIVRDEGISDPINQNEIRRLCRAYPSARLVLAHVARSFNYRNAYSGLSAIADLDNVVVDSSAICESEAFMAALKILGPKRILWGSDFAVSEMRGRCVSTGSHFFWLHPQLVNIQNAPTTVGMTLVGIESLLALREACDNSGLTRSDIQDIFFNNALKVLQPHLPGSAVTVPESGEQLWEHARMVISGGTGLLSKRAELYDSKWPSYFSRCAGCEVWDMQGRRYIDFAGGIGAVLLGYADPDVNNAVQRRIMMGTYCSLVNPQEVELADKLLQLHPWASKVRFARGGGEAMSVAVRIARAATGRSGVAFCGYHGWHDWYLAANLNESNALDGHLIPGLPPKGVPRELTGTSVPFRYNDMDSFEAALQKLGPNLAAVVMEPMRSQEPKDNFVAKVAEKCRKAGAVFVVDEITSGLRYGYPGALSRIGVDPDIVVYAKAMSNGFPFATVIGTEKIMAEASDSFISSSYWTDGIGPAAALATLEKIERLNIYEVVWERGRKFHDRLHQLTMRYPACKAVAGGMLSTPTLTFQAGGLSSAVKNFYVHSMLEKGFLVSSIYYLMYSHQQQHIDALFTALEDTFKELEQLVITNTLPGADSGQAMQQGFARLA